MREMPAQDAITSLAPTTLDGWSMYVHYMRHLGMPERVFEMPDPKRPGPPRKSKVDVAVWSPMGKGSTSLLATVGGCDRAMGNGYYVELMMLVRPAPDESALKSLARSLRDLVRLPWEGKGDLDDGRVIPVSAQGGPLQRFQGILLTRPSTFHEAFETVHYRHGKKVKIVWAVPVFSSEIAFADEHGAGALMQRFAEGQVDLAQLTRA